MKRMYLTLDKGPMFSGKTSKLVLLYQQYKRMGTVCLVVKHVLDTRHEPSTLGTHDGICIPCISIDYLRSLDIAGISAILIDEAQWFPDLYEWIREHFRIDIRVHVAGLNGDRDQRCFGQVHMLSSMCSEEHMHYSLCSKCGAPAPFSCCRDPDLSLITPGGDDIYYTVCYKHLPV